MCVFLSTVIMLTSFTGIIAAETTSVTKLSKLGLLLNVTDKDLKTELTRGIGITMVLKSLGYTQAKADAAKASTPFTGDKASWSTGWSALAYANNIALGKTATTFDPEAKLTEKELVAFELRALGYPTGESWINTEALAVSAGLIASGHKLNSKTYTKAQAAEVMYAALSATVKGTTSPTRLIDKLIAEKVVTKEAAASVGLVPDAVMVTAKAIDSTTIAVTLDKAISPIASDYTVYNSGTTVTVASASASDSGKVVILKVGEMAVGTKYTIKYSGTTKEVVSTIKNDETKPTLTAATALTGAVVRATLSTRNINKDTLIASNFILDNGATTTGVRLDWTTMAKSGQEGNTVVLLDVSGMTSGKAYTLRTNAITSYEGATGATSVAFAGKDKDTKAPAIEYVKSVSGYKVEVKFNEEGMVNDTALDVKNYTITPSIEVKSVRWEKNDYGDNIAILTTSDQKSGVAYMIKVDRISDGVNVIKDSLYNYFAGIDKVKNQEVVSVEALDATKVLVTYKFEANNTAIVAGNYSINNSISVASATFKSDGSIDRVDKTKVIITTGTMKSGVAYKMTIKTGVQDEIGQGLKQTAYYDFTGKWDAVAYLKITGVTALSTTKIKVTFNEKLAETVADQFALTSASGTFTLNTPTAVAGNDYVILTVGTTALSLDKVYTLTVGTGSKLRGQNTAHSFGTTQEGDRKVVFVGSNTKTLSMNISAIKAVDKTHVQVTFDSTLSITGANAEAGTLTLYKKSDLTGSALLSVKGMTLLTDKKTVVFTVPLMEDTTVYYAKVLKKYDTTDPTDEFKSVDGATMVCETGQAYKKLAFATPVLSTVSKLDITSTKMLDINTLEVVFSEDTTKALNKSAFDIAKTSSGSEIATINYVEWLNAKTCRIYFNIPSASLTNTNGVYYLKAVTTPVSSVTNAAFTWETEKNYEAFAYNATANAKPTIVSVENTSAKAIKVTTSERVYKGTTQTALDTKGNQFVIRDANKHVTLVPETDYSLTIGTSAESNKVFYITLKAGEFLDNGKYYIGFAEDKASDNVDTSVYGIDGIVKANSYVPTTNEETNGYNFKGIGKEAVLASPTATLFAITNDANDNERLVTMSPFTSGDVKGIEVYCNLNTVPVASTTAAVCSITSSITTMAGQALDLTDNITILPGEKIYYRFIDASGQKTQWVEDGIALGQYTSTDLKIYNRSGETDDVVILASTANTKTLIAGDVLMLNVDTKVASYQLTQSDISTLASNPLTLKVSQFTLKSGGGNLKDVDAAMGVSKNVTTYFTNGNGHKTPSVVSSVSTE